MRKRLLALALGLVLAASALAGCGSKGTGESAPAANEESPAVEPGAAEALRRKVRRQEGRFQIRNWWNCG